MRVPEAEAASQTLVVGFADMFLPAILASGIESEMTRFIIASVSVTQLIYMSEVGGLMLGSKIPVNFKDLVIIFLLRTLISLPNHRIDCSYSFLKVYKNKGDRSKWTCPLFLLSPLNKPSYAFLCLASAPID